MTAIAMLSVLVSPSFAPKRPQAATVMETVPEAYPAHSWTQESNVHDAKVAVLKSYGDVGRGVGWGPRGEYSRRAAARMHAKSWMGEAFMDGGVMHGCTRRFSTGSGAEFFFEVRRLTRNVAVLRSNGDFGKGHAM